MNAVKAETPIDLSELGFERACGTLRAPTPHAVMLYAAASNTCVANDIKNKYGCFLVLVPDEILRSPFVWAAEFGSSTYWSDAGL